MIEVSSLDNSEAVDILRTGGVGIIRTDTLYGIVARASEQAAVERVYDIKSRDETKSPIVLINDVSQLYDELPVAARELIRQGWPAKTTIIIPAVKAPHWLTRGNASVAYRLPDSAELRALLAQTGPLIAPSANPQGLTPATTIAQAKAYFGDAVDFYVDGGTVTDNTPSKIIRVMPNGTLKELR